MATAIVTWRCDEDDYFVTILFGVAKHLSVNDYVEMAAYIEYGYAVANPIVAGDSYDCPCVTIVPDDTEIEFAYS
jgi:hypothetical protein